MPSTTEGVGSVINGGNRHGTAIKQAVARGTDAGYLELVQSFPLRPIRSEVELDRAIAMIDSLLARDELDPGKADYLDVLSDLVHKYEAEHDPDAEMVRFLLESNEVAQTELAKQTGIAESTISEILAAKRQLSRRHIAALSKYFHVSPAVFFHEAEPMTS
jgi:HTH-type transcriptional regulator/antitoxin HigA